MDFIILMSEIKERSGNMSEKRYRVCISVPLGRRNGTMIIRESDGNVDGCLEVMGRKNAFFGCLSDDGQLTLSGAIQTLISNVKYTATGTVSERHLLLNIKTASGAYYPVSGEECSIDDEIL